MSEIRRLPDDVRGKIAAGEVIERPASVVKELVENSLDAGATDIRIAIRAGGRELIRVVDDGGGIEAAELPLAFSPHATSKLRVEDDLLNVRTLGFRGEALASITAVAELSIASSSGPGETGRVIVRHGDELLRDEPYGGPGGTEVTVSRLFANFPVRLEFLKSERTELFRVMNITQHLALGHPHVRFTLTSDDRVSFQTTGTGSLRDALVGVYDARLIDDTIELPPDEFQGIHGFIGQPGKDRPNRRHISFYVNRRWVTNRTLLGALTEAYRGMMPSGRHPIAIIHLTVPPDSVDVNIHPTKTEIRFREDGLVFGRVSKAIRRTLIERGDYVAVEPGPEALVDSFFVPARLPAQPRHDGFPRDPVARPPGGNGDFATVAPEDPVEGLQSPTIRPLGQIGSTYVVATGPDGLYLVDQHAAHERVTYERLLEQDKAPDRQPLLAPLTADLASDASAWVAENLERLGELGFDVEHFGDNTWLIRAVPVVGADRDPQALFTEIVAEMLEVAVNRAGMAERLRWSVACHSSIRAGDRLSIPEMQALLDELARCDLGRTCPHGRPTILKFTREMLDRQFGRT
jgi:DNA mismatch repair protein MutL